MKILITMILTTAAILSLNANSASVTTQVQKMSYVSSYYDPSCDSDPTYCDPYTIDYSNDDLFYTFTATWDQVSSILNISVSDGNSGQFTDGYYDDGYDPSTDYYMGSSVSEYVTIDVSDGQINSFHARYYYTDDTTNSNSTTRWFYDGSQLVRTNDDDQDYGMSYSSDTLSYDVINPVPVPAAAWLFGSALVGLGAVKRKKT